MPINLFGLNGIKVVLAFYIKIKHIHSNRIHKGEELREKIF